MGFGITAVCTVAAYGSRYTNYDDPVLIPYWTGFVQGGNCSLVLDQFTGDAGDTIEFFNVTNTGNLVIEPITCVINSTLGCQTNYFTFDGTPYEQNNFDLLAGNSSGLYQAVNWTYYILPPVPSIPLPPRLVNGNRQLQITTSQWSSEYNGATLIGCLTAAGVPNTAGSGLTAGYTTWTPPAGTFPATLSSTQSANTLANNTIPFYTGSQNTNYTINLSQLGNVNVSSVYDIWLVCYNQNGPSLQSVAYNVTTGTSLNSAASAKGSALVAAVVALATLLAAL